MNKLLTFVALLSLPLLFGCASSSDSALLKLPHSTTAALATYSTPELEARRVEVLETIARIEHEVELKSGLHMGVVMQDDRGRLVELFDEANAIERELLRRAATAQESSGPQTLKASL